MSSTSYSNNLIKENSLKNKHSYKKQAEQTSRKQKTIRCSNQMISLHSEDCPIGEAEKDILIGKLLEEKAKKISIVAQEICDIQQEWQRELKNTGINNKEQIKQQSSLNIKEIEDREKELKNIEYEIIDILKNREQERLLKNLKKKHSNRNKKDKHILDNLQKWPLNNKYDNNNVFDDKDSLFQKDEDGINDVEDEINFIESLVEEDIFDESINFTFDTLSNSMGENEDINLESNFGNQNIEHEVESQYVEMQKILEEIENEFE